MASLRKFKASRFWFAVYRDATGKQCNRSTKIPFTGEGDSNAERARDAAEKERRAAEIARLYEETERGHPTEQHIQRVLFDIFAKVNKRRIEPTVTERYFQEWLGRVKIRRGEGGTLVRYQNIVDDFLAALGARKAMQLGDVTAGDVQAFVDAQIAAGKAAGTVRVERKVLNAAFAEALKQGVISFNPAAAASVPVAPGEERKPFAWNQVRAILAAAEGEWKTAVMLGVFTGARLGDCVGMRWRNVDFTGRVVRFRPAKNRNRGTEIIVPLHPDLEEHLMGLPMPDGDRAGEALLCPKLGQAAIGGRSGLSRKFKEILDAAGIENETTREGKGKGRSFSAYGFHSLRHTFNTVLMNKGVAQELRMKLSGHASEKMNNVYSHAEIETLRNAVEKMPGVKE